jgi:H+/Cl- antiporter ClcA
MVFTVLTVSSGFKGGEVTPLFYMGASLGNAVAQVCGGPMDLLAASGMVAVFAGASKAPWACAVLGGELFGWQYVPVFLAVCGIAERVSGNRGLYGSRSPGGLG